MVDISMTDGAMSWLAMAAGAALRRRQSPRRGEVLLGGGVLCYLTYEAADGWVFLRRARAEVLEGLLRGDRPEDLIEHQFERPGGEAWEKVAEVFRSSRPGPSGRPSTTSTTAASSRSSTSTRRSSPTCSASGTWSSSSTSRASARSGRSARDPVKLATPAAEPSAAPAIGERHRRTCSAEPGSARDEIEALFESGVAAGPGGGGETEFRA